MKKQLLIAGGTGLIGKVIQKHALSNGWIVTILSRSPGPDTITWSPDKGSIDIVANMHFDAIINLAGSSISEGRWTDKRKKDIYESRIKSCRTLENYLVDGRISTRVYIGASAVGIYGDRGAAEVNEDTPVKADDWFARTVIDWEKGHRKVEAIGIRTVIIRFGLVLSEQGGALGEILKPARFGVLPYFGNGSQLWPWIHIDDLVAMMFFCMERPELHGIFLGTAPSPVTNKQFINALNFHLKRKKIVAGVPRIVLALMLGEMHRVLFESCNARPQKIMKHGFVFSFPEISGAAKDLALKIENEKYQ